ncbi:MAG TPA: bifunctional nuclease family protein [Deltaproteobacteria bacterium]|nr:bifunctional nuclease family protein [Deltaproteobacteria bacterium]
MRAGLRIVKSACKILILVIVLVVPVYVSCAADSRSKNLDDRCPVFVGNVVMLPESAAAVVFLVTTKSDRYLPITIGRYEASAILRSLSSIETPRPMTHDLLLAIVGRLDARIAGVTVTSIDRGTFKAVIEIEREDGSTIMIDARPSDSIALAVETGAALFVAATVLEQAGKKMNDEAYREPERSEPREIPAPRKDVTETIL